MIVKELELKLDYEKAGLPTPTVTPKFIGFIPKNYDEYCEGAIQNELGRSVKSHKLRSKTLTRAGAEMTYEVRLSDQTEVVTRMLDIEGVHDATLVACQSEVGA